MTDTQAATFADVEAAVAHVLRLALTCPVYGQLPPDPPFPCVRVQRITGGPVNTRPLYLDAAYVQVDVFADSKGAAHSVVDVCRVVVANIANEDTPFGWLTGARLGGLNFAPDTTHTPPLARYRFDATVWGRVTTPVARTRPFPTQQEDTLP
jgi:hypothetical protein